MTFSSDSDLRRGASNGYVAVPIRIFDNQSVQIPKCILLSLYGPAMFLVSKSVMSSGYERRNLFTVFFIPAYSLGLRVTWKP